MALFEKSWAGEILLETKRIHGLDHDATAQEVHEQLRKVDSYEHLAAAAKTAAETEAQTAVEAAQQATEAAENRAEKAEADLTAAQATVESQKKQIEKLQADLDAANAEVQRLKKEPAAERTAGPTEEPEARRSTRSYDSDPVTQRARKIAGK